MLKIIQEKCEQAGARLVAVSKQNTVERIMLVYGQGQRIFGENRVQELLPKYEAMPKDIQWHLIGHLQRNKVKYIAPFVQMIHSIDSLELLMEVNKQAQKCGRIIDCLLQFHIAQEETKFGLDLPEALALLESPERLQLSHVRLCGVMGMASFSDDLLLVRSEFRTLKGYFDQLKTEYFNDQPAFKEISMGMSGDWELALAEGSTMIRVGSLIFND
jgi:PLP dependent protein